MENLATVAVIIGLIKAIKEYIPGLHGLGTILLAVGLGVGAGYLRLEGLTVQTGIIAGLSAIGVHTAIKTVK